MYISTLCTRSHIATTRQKKKHTKKTDIPTLYPLQMSPFLCSNDMQVLLQVIISTVYSQTSADEMDDILGIKADLVINTVLSDDTVDIPAHLIGTMELTEGRELAIGAEATGGEVTGDLIMSKTDAGYKISIDCIVEITVGSEVDGYSGSFKARIEMGDLTIDDDYVNELFTEHTWKTRLAIVGTLSNIEFNDVE